RDAARFEADDRRRGRELHRQRIETARRVSPCEVEQAVVVERAATAEAPFREDDLEARALEELDRGDAGLRMEGVREGVRPQHDATLPARPRPSCEPRPERSEEH